MNIRTRIKWLDPVTQNAMMALCLPPLLLAYLKSGNKNYLILFILLCIVLIIYSYTTVKHGQGLILENRFGGPIKFKPEEGCNAEPLSTLPQKADGINTGIYPGRVYKLRSGTNVYVDEQGRVRCYSFISCWVNPGWIGADAVHNDSCWLTLF